jgi:hypothetical protein
MGALFAAPAAEALEAGAAEVEGDPLALTLLDDPAGEGLGTDAEDEVAPPPQAASNEARTKLNASGRQLALMNALSKREPGVEASI